MVAPLGIALRNAHVGVSPRLSVECGKAPQHFLD